MDGTKLLTLYRQMYLMRRFEEEAARSYTERKIGGFLHLYIGQEAVASGVLDACHETDYVITAYRDHAHYLARGGSARAGMAELFGKATGCSKGRGGSMHFFDAENRFLGGHGIVGAHVPLASGIAFAAKYRREGTVCVCFLGDGAVNIGPFHEGLCLAAIWKLPVVFIIENNLYAMGTPMSRSVASEDASIRALGYPMARFTAPGVDVVEVRSVAERAIRAARESSEPTLLEFKTYRYRGHSMADPAKYRTKEELESWKERDPLLIAQARIEKEFPALAGKIGDLQKSVEEEVGDAVAFADSSPEPDPETLFDFNYV